MFLEYWMLAIIMAVWIYALFDMYKNGVNKGVNTTIDMLEANQMILTEVNENGDTVICKLIKAEPIKPKRRNTKIKE